METDEVYNTFPGKDYNQMFTEVVSTLWLQASLLSSNPTPQYNGCHLNQPKPTSYHHLKKHPKFSSYELHSILLTWENSSSY